MPTFFPHPKLPHYLVGGGHTFETCVTRRSLRAPRLPEYGLHLIRFARDIGWSSFVIKASRAVNGVFHTDITGIELTGERLIYSLSDLYRSDSDTTLFTTVPLNRGKIPADVPVSEISRAARGEISLFQRDTELHCPAQLPVGYRRFVVTVDRLNDGN